MSKPLNRPMFRMGGKPDTNTGIVSGFETPRQKYDDGDHVHPHTGSATSQDVIDMLAIRADTDEKMSGMREELANSYMSNVPAEKGFGFNDYMSLVKLGAGIAGAPNKGSGFKGFVSSSAPAIGQFADDLSQNSSIKQARLDAYNKEKRLAEQSLLKMDMENLSQSSLLGEKNFFDLKKLDITQQNAIDLLDKENKNKLEQIKLDNDLDKTEFEKMITTYETYSKVIMTSKDPQEIIDAYNAIGISLSKVVSPVVSKFTSLDIDNIAISAKKMIQSNDALPQEGSPGYGVLLEQYIQSLSYKKALGYLGLNLGNLNEIVEQARIKEADGGRIGYANGSGPYEPGSGPNPDPGSPPIMQANNQTVSYQELRSRLPQEVSDQVVRLLANSEEALFIFANIETQEDIANFNQRFNADLRMPAQAVA
mgnify:FL=1